MFFGITARPAGSMLGRKRTRFVWNHKAKFSGLKRWNLGASPVRVRFKTMSRTLVAIVKFFWKHKESSIYGGDGRITCLARIYSDSLSHGS